MTLYEFQALDLNRRAEYVWGKGDYVGSDPQAPSNFYVVNDFYVEVILNPGTTKILLAVPFTTGARYWRMVEIIDVPV